MGDQTKLTKPSVMIRASQNAAGAGRTGYRRADPITAAVATKLVRDTRLGLGQRSYTSPLTARRDVIFGESERIAQNMNDAENIFEVLPETERCEMIITSCILSPDDMKTVDLRYVCDRTWLPAAIESAMTQAMEDFGNKTYKIKEKLPKIIKRALFRSGSYPILIVPESSLDALINDDNRIAMESYDSLVNDTRWRGVLGDNNATLAAQNKSRTTVAFESFLNTERRVMTNPKVLPNLTVTDNPNVVKLPLVQEKLAAQRIADAYKPTWGLEAFQSDGERLNDVARRLYVRRRSRVEEVVRLRTQDQTNRNSVGHPLTIDLSSDACIVVANPTNMQEHLGYFIPLDGFGNPVNNGQDSLYANELQKRLKNHQTEVSGVLAEMKTSMYGLDDTDANYTQQMYGDFIEYIERDLLERFANGENRGRAVHISRPNQVYQMMFARILANKQTQLLYVPRELVTYFAFDYNKRGIGKSLTDGTKIIASLRALLLFSSTRSAVRAAVGHKTLNLTLDPEIADPLKWAQQMLHEYIRVNNGNYPLGTSDPNDILSYMEQAGISVNIKNHPAFPEVSAEIESTTSAITTPDPELDRELRNRHISRYGLPPEVVDASTGVDFAATIRTSNVFFDKQITQYAESLCRQTSEHLRTLAVNSGLLMAELFKIIDDNVDQVPDRYKQGEWRTDMVVTYLENFRVELPESNSTKLETQLAKLTTYTQVLDAVLAAFATPELLTTLDPAADRETAESVITVMKQHFIREFVISEGIMPEITDVLTWPGDDDNPAFDFMRAQTAYVEALGNTIRNLMSKTKEFRASQQPAEANQSDTGGGWNSEPQGGADDLGF